MKIAYLLPSLENRGPVIFTRNLINGLIEDSSIIVEVFYIRNRPSIEFPVKCSKLSMISIWRLFRFDLIHSTMFLPDLINSLFPVRKRRKIASMHNFIQEDMIFLFNKMKARIISTIWLKSLAGIGNFIYSSKYMAEHYRGILKSKTDAVIGYGIPTLIDSTIDAQDEKIFDHYASQSLRIIGAVSMVLKRKGIDQLVRALVEMKDYAVVVIGDGPEVSTLLALAKILGVDDRFSILGFRVDSARYYKRFDVFAMVSFSEGYCLAMLEGMACGTPIVCSRLPIYRDTINENDVAFFEPGNIDDLISAINKVVLKSEFYSEASRRLYRDQFSVKKMVNEHVQFYQSLLGSLGKSV